MRNRISNSNRRMQSPKKTGPTYLFDVPFYCCPPTCSASGPSLATLLYLEHTRCISPLGLDLAFPVPRSQAPRHPHGSDVTSFKSYSRGLLCPPLHRMAPLSLLVCFLLSLLYCFSQHWSLMLFWWILVYLLIVCFPTRQSALQDQGVWRVCCCIFRV